MLYKPNALAPFWLSTDYIQVPIMSLGSKVITHLYVEKSGYLIG